MKAPDVVKDKAPCPRLSAGPLLRELMWGPADLPEQEAGRLRAQQIAAVVNATPLMMVGNITVAVAVLAVFWDTQHFAMLAIWAAAFSAMAVLTIWQWLQGRGRPSRSFASVAAVKRLTRRAMLPACFLALLPIVLFAEVGPQQKLLISSIVTGSLCVGLFGLSSVPVAAAAYAGVIAAASILSMMMTGDAEFITVGLLLVVYIACALGSVIWYSRLFVDRFMHSLAMEKQRELIGILLHDFEKQASDWLWETDAQGRIQLGAARFAEAIGAETVQVSGRSFASLLGTGSDTQCPELRPIFEAFGAQEAFGGLVAPLGTPDGQRWLSLTGKPVFDADGRFSGYRGVASDVTEAKRSETHIRHMAHHDALTGLPNRTMFGERLERALGQLADAGSPFSILLIDLDNFKTVNDTLGHGAGDRLLMEMSRRLAELLPSSAMLARLGGDEFAIILAGEPAGEAFDTLSARLLEALASGIMLDGVIATVGGSIGVAGAPADGADAETLLRRADLALYRAKAEGRGRVRRFEESIEVAAQHRRIIEENLRAAVEAGQLDLHYQPIVELASGRFVAAEALLRWRHPDFGLISPAQFIPIAEDTGLIIPIGRWVLERACRDAARWDPALALSVNLSPQQFKDPGLLDAVRGALSASGLDPARLELEITETAVMSEASASGTVDQIKSLGVKLALDDFGTGYSSLSYLRQLPFDKIKIDRSFVREAATRPQSLAIIETIVELGRKLNATTVAEGIETAFERNAAIAAGCNLGQGWAFGRAMPLAEFVEAVADSRRAAA